MGANVMTLDQAIEAAMQLHYEQREMLLDILRRCQIEARRERIAAEAQASLAAYRAGELPARTAAEAIVELHRFIEEDA